MRAAAVHPGGIQDAELGRHMDPAAIEKMIEQMNQQSAAEGKLSFPVEDHSSRSRPYFRVGRGRGPPANEIGGRYCENCHVSHIVPDEAIIGVMNEGVRGYALDSKATAEALWKKKARNSSASRFRGTSRTLEIRMDLSKEQS